MVNGENTRVRTFAPGHRSLKNFLLLTGSCSSLVDYILFIQADVDLEPSPNEVRDTAYVSQEGLKKMFKDPALKFTPWFKLICESMLYEWWGALGTPSFKKYLSDSTLHRM